LNLPGVNLVEHAVRRPVANWMRILIFILLGVVAFLQLPIDLLPSVTQPQLYIVTEWPGVSPEDLETQITRPLEDAAATVPGVVRLTSTTSEGQSQVSVEFGPSTDMRTAALDLLQQVERAQSQFPTGDPTLKAPTLQKFDPNAFPVLILGASGISDPVRLRTVLTDEIKPILESAEGVATAEVEGGQERAIMVHFESQNLLARSLTSEDLVQAIATENQNVKGGTARDGKLQLLARTFGWLQNLDDLRAIPVGRSPGGRLVPLRSVATVTDSYKEPSSFQRLNGSAAASISIQKQSHANTISTVRAVQAKLDEVKRKHPELQFHEILNQSEHVQAAVHSLQEAALLGGGLAMLVVFFFLRNFRSTLVVATSIPVSVISTFTFVHVMGYSLNTMTLVGLALATGLIVDDAVVVMENIYRKMEHDGQEPVPASIEGAREITSAVISATVTLMVVFLPLMLIPGQLGQMFRPFAVVIIVSMAFSLLDALTGVPMLCSQFIRISPPRPGFWQRTFDRWESWHHWMDRVYERILRRAIRARGWVFGGGVLVTALSLLLVPLIGFSFLPRADVENLYIQVNLPRGSALEETDKVVDRVEDLLGQRDDVSAFLATVGDKGKRDQGQIYVALKESRKQGSDDICLELQEDLGDLAEGTSGFAAPINLVGIVLGGSAQGAALELDIFGPDLKVLAKLSEQFVAALQAVPGLADIRNEAGAPAAEVRWTVDREKATQLGVSFAQVARAIETASEGRTAGFFQAGGRRAPIVVQLADEDRKTVALMERMVISSQPSGTDASPGTQANAATGVQLGQVADAETVVGFSTIKRMTRQRYTSLVSAAQQGSMNELQRGAATALAKIELPPGYDWSWGTLMAQQAAEFRRLSVMVGMALVLIYMLLAIQFENLVVPLSILLSVPLCLVGVVLAFFLTNTDFSIMAGVGCLMLMGIAVKNGILLVENTILKRATGLDRDAAMLQACPERLRPILITACAAIVGMIPIALRGRGGELEAPMAIAVIGGLCASTLLTLFIVPCAYAIFDDLETRLFGKTPPLDESAG
jgi:hydrophobic/amphiphilic exporter-1 (mainly G- bacteria), HAE1 family